MELSYKQTTLNSLGNTLKEAGFSEQLNVESICYSCLFQDSVIGHLVILNTSIEYIIASLYVIPMFRGLGISTELLNIGIKPLFKSQQKRVVFKLHTKTNSISLAGKIATKNRLSLSLLEPIFFVVEKNSWTKMIRDRFGDFISFNGFSYRVYSELTNNEIEEITDYSEKNLPDFLRPFEKFDSNRELLSVFIFDQTNNIKAWSIVHSENINDIYIECTYVMQVCRKEGLGILSWEVIKHRLSDLNLLDQVKKITFAVDTINPRAYELFKNLTKDILQEEIRYYKLLPQEEFCIKC